MSHTARPIYLDYASTTPVHPTVLAAMEPFLRHEFGNPSNLYPVGPRLTALRDRLIAGIEAAVPGALLNGDRRQRLPGHVNFCFGDVQGESILLALELHDVYASSGSACHAGSQDPS